MALASPGVLIRDARLDDAATIVRFNLDLAWETERKRLDEVVIARGVEAALADPARLRYWIAEVDGRIAGQAAITREWSDWRNGWIWWFQSVYVDHAWRRLGVFKELHGRIRAIAAREPEVVGLRLYVEEDNARAKKTYESLGMRHGGYAVYEELWIDREFKQAAAAPNE